MKPPCPRLPVGWWVGFSPRWVAAVGVVAMVGAGLVGCGGEPGPPRSDRSAVERLLAAADADPLGRDALIQAGAATFRQMACATCHGFDNQPMTGPRLDGLYERPLRLTDGTTATRDRAYLWRSIALPQDELVHGYGGASRMTNFGTVLDNEEVAGLIAYLESRTTGRPGANSDSAKGQRPIQ